ncbi:MAG: hypothetical protein Q9169_006303 [Polycauliona sp. 2 TL-2023]
MADWTGRDWLDTFLFVSRVVEVADGLSDDADRNRNLAQKKLIEPLQTSRHQGGSPSKTVPSRTFPPPPPSPNSAGQGSSVGSERHSKQSQPSKIPVQSATEGRAGPPPLPPRPVRQSDIRSRSAEGTLLRPDLSTESPSPGPLASRSISFKQPIEFHSIDVLQPWEAGAALKILMPPIKLSALPWICYKARSLLSTQIPRTQSSKELSHDKRTLSDALKDTKREDNSLLSPVHIPEDPNGVLNEKHPATPILANSSIIVQRQLELMNVMIGFEQANKYVILDPQGHHIGFMAEQDNSMGKTMSRQFLSTHRTFTTHVFDKHEKEVLRFRRPFSWISSRISVYDPVEVAVGSHSRSRDMIESSPGSLSAQVNPTPSQISSLSLSEMRTIGNAQQKWAPLRRKYNLFTSHQNSDIGADLNSRPISSGDLPRSPSKQLQIHDKSQGTSSGQDGQFAYLNEPFLSWNFSLLSTNDRKIGSVNRDWGGIGRELFTDTGVYALRMDAANFTHEQGQTNRSTDVSVPSERSTGMTLDQRAVMLATAVSIDFDYFSRHSGSSGGMGWMPLWFPGAGGEAAATGGAAEGAGAAGEGSIIRGAAYSGADKAKEGAAIGAGSVAGYDAMQSGAGRSGAEETTFGEEFHDEFLDPGDGEHNPEEKESSNYPGEPSPGGFGGGRGNSSDGRSGGGGSDGGDGIGGSGDGVDGGGAIDVGGGGDFFDF